MYWEIEEAVKELERRQNNVDLQRKVDALLGNDCPVPAGQRLGILARHLPSARLEEYQFVKRVKDAGLTPCSLSYSRDKFCPENPEKKCLVIVRTFDGFGRKGGVKSRRIDLVKNMERWKGELIKSIKTDWGEKLLEFHLRAHEGLIRCSTVDMSDWLSKWGSAAGYYPYFLLLGVSRGIIFESFEPSSFDNQLELFKRRVVSPALEKIKQWEFPPPLIVRHPASDIPEEIVLNYYLPEIMEYIPPEYRSVVRRE